MSSLLVGVAGALSMGLYLSYHQIGVSFDSEQYFLAAESVLNGRGFYVRDVAFIHWPPLYPSLIALGLWFGLKLKVAAAWINALAFGVLVSVTFSQLTRHRVRALAIIFVLALLWFAVPIRFVFGMAWSEPLFIALAAFALECLDRYFLTRLTRWWLAAAFAVSLASFSRYIGILEIGLFSVALGWFSRGRLTFRTIRVVVFSALAAFPLWTWLERNQRLGGSAFGERPLSTSSFQENTWRSLDVVSGWFLPAGMPVELRAALVLVPVSLVFLRARSPISLVSGLWLVVYSVGLLASAGSMGFDPLDSRLWSPVFFPAVMGITLALSKA